MTIREVKVVGLNELVAKLDWDVLAQPEVALARDSIVERIEGRPGKGLGAKRNTLTSAVEPLSATVQTSLNYPRTKGTSWGRKNEGIVKSMAPRVMKKAVQRMEARWAISNRGGFGS